MKVVLFDLDGTLVKAGGAGRKALDRAIKRFHGVDAVCSKFSLAGRTDKQNFHLAHLHATGKKPTPSDVRKVQTAYLRLLPAEVRKAVRGRRYEEIPGIGKLLRRLSKRRGILLGLGTGNLEEGARIKLEPSGLRGYFSFGGFGSDGYSRLRMLRCAVRRAEKLSGAKVRPRDVYVVGDTPRDVEAGKKAGYRTAAVTSGFGDPREIEKSRPDFSAPDFRDSRSWLRWLGLTAARPSRTRTRSRRRGRP